MFYEPALKNHGLRHSPLKALVSPRPIGWISTLSEDGLANLAPYSFFNMIGEEPALVMFASMGLKDSARNVEATGEFVCNLATLDLIEAVNLSAAPAPAEMSEFSLTGLETAPSRLVQPPRVARAPCALECVHVETFRPRDRHGETTSTHLIIGEVVGVHINDEAIIDGRVDVARLQVLSRCGYLDYSVIDRLIPLKRPRLSDIAGD